MLTKDVTEELHGIMQQLQNQGKEPTVALVKARLSSNVPIPALITTIKTWKNANRVPKVEIAATESNENNRIEELEKKVADLTSRLIALEKKLDK
ncbi:hypothetical protein ACQEXU_05975 [Vibrio sp. TRT 21S02]|uniref:hypothetical protein n=1 Tax=unclassified Vibrio TaxID=2614977 RepID=UPI00349FA149